jgi:hypothetical protein
MYETEVRCSAKEENYKATSNTAVLMNIKVFCDKTPSRLVNGYRPFGGALCLYSQGSVVQ